MPLLRRDFPNSPAPVPCPVPGAGCPATILSQLSIQCPVTMPYPGALSPYPAMCPIQYAAPSALPISWRPFPAQLRALLLDVGSNAIELKQHGNDCIKRSAWMIRINARRITLV